MYIYLAFYVSYFCLSNIAVYLFICLAICQISVHLPVDFSVSISICLRLYIISGHPCISLDNSFACSFICVSIYSCCTTHNNLPNHPPAHPTCLDGDLFPPVPCVRVSRAAAAGVSSTDRWSVVCLEEKSK